MGNVYSQVKIGLGKGGRPTISHTMRHTDGSYYRSWFELEPGQDMKEVIQKDIDHVVETWTAAGKTVNVGRFQKYDPQAGK